MESNTQSQNDISYLDAVKNINKLNILNKTADVALPEKDLITLADQSQWDETGRTLNASVNRAATLFNDYFKNYSIVIQEQIKDCNKNNITWFGSIVVFFTSLIYLLLIKPLNTLKNPSELDEEEKIKEKNVRGGIASLTTTLMFAFINFASDNLGQADPSTSTALIGLLLGGTCGYIADIYFGTDVGFSRFNTNKLENLDKINEESIGPKAQAFQYAIGNLVTANYLRYIITVLMDSFISLILLKPLLENIITKRFFMCGNNQAYGNAIVSAVIGLITFQAYANQTRFQWAYPDPGTLTKTAIHPASIFMATTAFAVLFLLADTGSTGINAPKAKLGIVCFTLALLTLLNQIGADKSKNLTDNELSSDEINKLNENLFNDIMTGEMFGVPKKWAGLITFIVVSFGSVVLTLMSSIAPKNSVIMVGSYLIFFIIWTLLYFWNHSLPNANTDKINFKNKNWMRAFTFIVPAVTLLGFLVMQLGNSASPVKWALLVVSLVCIVLGSIQTFTNKSLLKSEMNALPPKPQEPEIPVEEAPVEENSEEKAPEEEAPAEELALDGPMADATNEIPQDLETQTKKEIKIDEPEINDVTQPDIVDEPEPKPIDTLESVDMTGSFSAVPSEPVRPTPKPFTDFNIIEVKPNKNKKVSSMNMWTNKDPSMGFSQWNQS